jgi:hypothetical protein
LQTKPEKAEAMQNAQAKAVRLQKLFKKTCVKKLRQKKRNKQPYQKTEHKITVLFLLNYSL